MKKNEIPIKSKRLYEQIDGMLKQDKLISPPKVKKCSKHSTPSAMVTPDKNKKQQIPKIKNISNKKIKSNSYVKKNMSNQHGLHPMTMVGDIKVKIIRN